ncbi:hypothetical protein [Rudaea sp.]|uniref:hypothetical protein n=1 Tax=Rudaea sp. TaxID=2136325 RepID=UPI0039E4E43D
MNGLDVAIAGVAVCAPGLPAWDAALPRLRGDESWAGEALVRPAPALLSPNERRRAPDSVLLALAVAEQACAMAGHAPAALPNVFGSAYGDLAINDYQAISARARGSAGRWDDCRSWGTRPRRRHTASMICSRDGRPDSTCRSQCQNAGSSATPTEVISPAGCASAMAGASPWAMKRAYRSSQVRCW